MPQILVWKSSEDGKIFEDKSKYQTHLRKLARERLTKRKITIAEEAKNVLWAPLYEREQSIDDWFQMVIDHQDLFWSEAAAGDPNDWKCVGTKRNGVIVPVPKIVSFRHSMRWRDDVSNSHSCPVYITEDFADVECFCNNQIVSKQCTKNWEH